MPRMNEIFFLRPGSQISQRVFDTERAALTVFVLENWTQRVKKQSWKVKKLEQKWKWSEKIEGLKKDERLFGKRKKLKPRFFLAKKELSC